MNDWGIWAIRSSFSAMGASEAWARGGTRNERIEMTEEDARSTVDRLNRGCQSSNVSYQARPLTT